VEHCVSLVAGSCSKRPVGVGHAVVLLHHTLAVWQNMTVVVELHRILRSMGQRIERRRAHMLRGEMVVVLVNHARCGEMAERRRVLVESCRHHCASVVGGLGHYYSSRQQRMGLNDDGVEINV
jgi:hypothetical protein